MVRLGVDLPEIVIVSGQPPYDKVIAEAGPFFQPALAFLLKRRVSRTQQYGSQAGPSDGQSQDAVEIRPQALAALHGAG